MTSYMKGASHGMVRLSNAIQASPSSSLFQPRPGMGLKLLRDGMDSANLVRMIVYLVNSIYVRSIIELLIDHSQ